MSATDTLLAPMQGAEQREIGGVQLDQLPERAPVVSSVWSIRNGSQMNRLFDLASRYIRGQCITSDRPQRPPLHFRSVQQAAESVSCWSCCQLVALLDQRFDLAPVERGRVIVTHWLAATFRKVSDLRPTHCTVTSALVSAAKGSTSAAASVRPRPPAGDNRSISAVHLMASRHAGQCERFDPVRYAESKTPSAGYGVFR
jgi:hypothetical protein